MRKVVIAVLCIAAIVLAADLISDISSWFDPGQTAPLSVSAIEMWEEFEADKNKAEDFYRNKTVSITGVVAEKAENFLNKPCVLLENGVDSIPDGIFCFLANASELEDCEIGSTVTITGECSFGVEIYGDGIWISLYNSSVAKF